MAADLILRGGRIRTLGRHGLRPVSHLAVSAGRVLAVGGAEVMGLRGPRTELVELLGASVLPGFNDAHAHVVYTGLTSFGALLEGCRDLDQMGRRLRRAALALDAGEWLQGRGFSVQELGQGRPPTRIDLDRMVGDRPCFVDDRGGHLRVANTAALEAAEITTATPDPPGGSIGRAEDGTPDGLLLESAMRLVADRQPPVALERRLQGVLRVQRLLLSRGITSVGAAVNRGHADDLRVFQQLLEAGRLRIRVTEFLSWELLEAAARLGLGSGFGSPMLRAGPLKVFVDGGISSGGAALRSGQGVWRTPPDELGEIFLRAEAAGLQVACHAIGDAAVEAVIEAAAPGGGRLRHRIEHATVFPPDLRARAAALGLVAVMQPLAAPRRSWAASVLGPEVEPHLAVHREVLQAGVRLAFSSDLPVTPDPDPWPGLAAAVLDPDHPITALSALRAYTLGGAWASREEGFKGTLEPGRAADFQVLDQDPIALGPRRWAGLRPRLVAVAGRPAWGRW